VAWDCVRGSWPARRRWPQAALHGLRGVSRFANGLPDAAELCGIERVSAEFSRAEALERVAVLRQHLSFRSPLSYFHNGLAATIEDVVDLYQTSLGFVFTRAEAADLVAFLRAL
jgi:cytochrome c peroxidase